MGSARPLILLLALIPLAGCQVPSYRLPAGFSSTYHRALYGPRPEVAPPPAEPGLFSGHRSPSLKLARQPNAPSRTD